MLAYVFKGLLFDLPPVHDYTREDSGWGRVNLVRSEADGVFIDIYGGRNEAVENPWVDCEAEVLHHQLHELIAFGEDLDI